MRLQYDLSHSSVQSVQFNQNNDQYKDQTLVPSRVIGAHVKTNDSCDM